MNKNIITLAVAAAFAAPMAANAAPTAYGQLQMEYADVENCVAGVCTSNNVTDDQKRGRLGIKGSEDLGNGLKAIYKFEWQVDTSTAALTDGTRNSFVGLKGDWGTFKAGTLKSAYKYAGGVKYDPFVATFLEARSRGGMSGKLTDLTSAFGNPAKGAFGHHGFLPDNISYANKFGGNFHFNVTLGMDETGGAKGRDGDMTASLKYKTKNWEAFAALANDDDFATGGLPDTGVGYEATKIGGQWKSGPHKISAQLEKTDFANGSIESDVMFLGYQFKMGKNIFVAQMGTTEIDGAPDSVDYTAFGVIHKFSKKTRVFAGVSTMDDSLGFVNGITTTENNAVSLGMRVDF